MIRVENVRKVYPTRFGNKVVLDGVSLDLAKGERLGILGRNGAGKSTLIRLISGAEKPNGGRVERHMSVSWPLAFGGAFQAMLTGRDNVRFISGIYRQDFERNMAFVEEFSELGPYLREPIRTYSSGMRARLAFAISMIIEFDCFLIDEIASVGDARFHDKCNFELFEKRADRAMIIISHDAAYIRDHCTRWAVLHEGKLTHYDDFEIAHGTFRDLISTRDRAARVAANLGSVLTIRNRLHLLELSHRTALEDDRFITQAQEVAWLRDKAERERDRDLWRVTEQGYAAMLQLYPFERSHWVLHGHARKEQNDLTGAEISYRTAIAHGEPAADVGVHLRFVMHHQGLAPDAWPAPHFRAGPLRDQLPGRIDIDLLARMLWHGVAPDKDEVLHFLRTHATFDALVATMLADPRCRRDPAAADGYAGIDMVEPAFGDWRAQALCIFLPETRGGERQDLIAQLAAGEPWLPLLVARGAFDGWERTNAILAGVDATEIDQVPMDVVPEPEPEPEALVEEAAPAPPTPRWIEAHRQGLDTAFAELVGEEREGRVVDLSDPVEAFPADQSCDVVIARDVLPRIAEPAAFLRQAYDSLCPGGMLVLSAANRDSLHLRTNRLFGRDDLPDADDDLCAYGYSEMQAMVRDAGFIEERAIGVTLMPYHGVEGLFPEPVRQAENDNADFNAMLQILGRRAGPDYAYGYVMKCRRPGTEG